MPAIPEWLPRLPEIILSLDMLSTMVLDREIVVHVFHVSRRQAIRLLHEFGARQTARGLAADRMQVLARLRGMLDDYEAEEQRKARLLADLEKSRIAAAGRKLRIDVSRYVPEAQDRGVAGLPATIPLDGGKLTLQYASPADP